MRSLSSSGDGARVAFSSTSTNLGEGDTDSSEDIYVKDLTTGALTLVTTSDAGAKSDACSSHRGCQADWKARAVRRLR